MDWADLSWGDPVNFDTEPHFPDEEPRTDGAAAETSGSEENASKGWAGVVKGNSASGQTSQPSAGGVRGGSAETFSAGRGRGGKRQ